jgi:cholesterol oxidase
MHWLSKPIEPLIQSIREDECAGHTRVLVVGSGYGGSVAALRFAQAGLKVTLLERGSEYMAGDFPVDLSQIGAFVRAETNGQTSQQDAVNVIGYEDALFDFRLGTRASALVANGLGGGSLINAAVALRPDPRIFMQSPWPPGLQHDALDQDFETASRGLEINSGADQRASESCVPQTTQKYQRLQEIGQAAHLRFASDRLTVSTEDVPLAIEFRKDFPNHLGPRSACIGCGDCCSGCNHDAKLSLNKTYLPRACLAGAELYTGVCVLSVLHDPLPEYPGLEWLVTCVRTSERGKWQQACKQGLEAAYVFQMRAARVVLAAGTFGSTEILLRSRSLGLDVAQAWLGKGISANGDDLSAAFDLDKPVQGVGLGGQVQPDSGQVGPTISGVVRFHDQQDPSQSTVMQDGGVPGMLTVLLQEILTTLAVLPQLRNFGMRGRAGKDPLAVSPKAIQHSLVLLGMGHDSAAGQATLATPEGRLGWGWPDHASDPAPLLHRQRGGSVEDCGAEFLPNPASGLLPDKLASVLSDSVAPTSWVTVHPLGGCRMASTPSLGVVNDLGQVFMSDGRVHAGLMVLDGSIVASSLGVNPMLTITALAERACRLVLSQEGRHHPQHHSQPHTPAQADATGGGLPEHPAKKPIPKVNPEAKQGAVLSEVLRGRLQPNLDCPQLPLWLKNADSEKTRPVALFLEMQVQDWMRLWQDPRHLVNPILTAGATKFFTSSRLMVDAAQGGSTELRVVGGDIQLFVQSKNGFAQRVNRFLRNALTYMVVRWLPDKKRPTSQPLSPVMIWDAAKLLWHASAARAFEYRLDLAHAEQRYRLLGSKHIDPALSWTELSAWCVNWVRHRNWPRPQRRSVWGQLTELDVQIFDARTEHCLAQGRLTMDLPEMLRRVAPQMHSGSDALSAMAALASYPALLLRYLVSSRLLDFRLPDYQANLPAKDPVETPDDGQFELQQATYPALKLNTRQTVLPEPPLCLNVRLKAEMDASHPETETIRLGLVHYAQAHVASQVIQSGLRRFKSILLLNGFAQNTLPFVAEELADQSLAAMLYAQGWDVWLFEYRVSPLLRASAKFSSMDDIAACDIPAAVDRVLAHLQAGQPSSDTAKGQLFVFSHCVGSASMGMSLLGGHLTYQDQTPKVAGVLFSQFLPHVVGSVTAQMRLQVASLLVNGLGLQYLEFAAGTCQADGLHALLDRLFASMHVEPHEMCPGEHDLRQIRPDTTSCKRMSGLLSRLFRHDQLVESTQQQPGTHEKLDQYFGRTNLGVFLHGAKCVEYERLVDADGQNIYVTDENVRRFMAMPVMLLHGEDNVLFDKDSLDETWRQFGRAFGPQRLLTRHDRALLATGHAHFDCTIGKRAPELIFPKVIDFFNNAFDAELPLPLPHNRLRARLARTGPLAGWRRLEGGRLLQRIWMEVDNTQSDQAVAGMTLVCVGKHRCVQAWPLSQQPMEGLVGVSSQASPDMSISYVVADVELPLDSPGVVTVMMVSLHCLSAPAPSAEDQTVTAWPVQWGQPISLAEVAQSGGRSPAFSPSLSSDSSVLQQGSAPGDDTHRLAASQACDSLVAINPVPFDGAKRIQPLPYALSWADARAVIIPLSRLVRDQRIRALKADPATLSRQRRTLRSMQEAVLRLRCDEYENHETTRFFAATCRHPGLTALEAERSDHVLQALAKHQRTLPAGLMWMLGDQIYADARAGLLDSESTIERLLPRYRAAFGSPGFRALARTTPLHMAMDDHEIGDNWSLDDEKLDADQALLSRNAIHAFSAFQRAYGPSALGPDGHDGACTLGAAAFLCLNTRIHRNRALGPNQQRQILHPEQWTLLESWLHAQQALGDGRQPKFIVTGSVVLPGLKRVSGHPSPRDTDNWQLVQAERVRLFALIAKHQFRNVVFLSGDYHCSACATVEFADSDIKAYALAAPPLYAPLRFANVAAHDIMEQETISWSEGSAQVSCKAWNGDGWLQCELQQDKGGGMTLHNHFYLQPMNALAPQRCSESWHLN